MSEPSLSDLDRCEHGRHAVDSCLDCEGGYSNGNPFLMPGQRIGTDYAGRAIIAEAVDGPRDRFEPRTIIRTEGGK